MDTFTLKADKGSENSHFSRQREMRYALALMSLGLLAGCSSPGPAFRGEPPAGYTRAEYERKLTGRTDFTKEFRTRDRSPSGDSISPSGTAL